MKALITGLCGQFGHYMSNFLVGQGLEVHGIYHKTLHNYSTDVTIHEGNVADRSFMDRKIKQIKPDFFINYAAISDSRCKDFTKLLNVNVCGTYNCLQALKEHAPDCKSLFMGSSHEFGRNYSYVESNDRYQDEDTCKNPRTPYGISKQTASQLVKTFRERYALKCVVAIQFNTYSKRSPLHTLPGKVFHFLESYEPQVLPPKIAPKPILKLNTILGIEKSLMPIEDSIKAHWAILNTDCTDDYCVGSGTTEFLSDFIERQFRDYDFGDDWEKYVEWDDSISTGPTYCCNNKKLKEIL